MPPKSPARARRLVVGIPFLEQAQPDLRHALESLYAQGHRKARMAPVFLGTGRHLKCDLLKLVGSAQARWP